MRNILTVLLLATLLFACNQATKIPTNNLVKAPVDSFITNWESNWNKHDSAAVRNMFLVDAILVDDNLVTANAAEISEKWIHNYIKVVNNLKSIKLQDWSSSDRAGYTGKYELDVIVNDSVVAKPRGIFAINWIKTEKNEWKITSAVIHSFKN